MIQSRYNIRVSETETELCLSIPASQRERARRIRNWRWNPERVQWVYPKTAEVYDALINEFGNELFGVHEINRPGCSEPIRTGTEDLQSENRSLREEISRIHETLELVVGAASDVKKSEIQALREVLVARGDELTEVRRRFQDLDRQLKDEQSKNQELSDEVRQLQAINEELQSKLEDQPRQEDERFRRRLKSMAKTSACHHERFCSFVDQLRFSTLLPIELVNELKNELRRALNCDDEDVTLYDLIAQAKDDNLLTERGINLAHTIRKQRNFMAHETLDQRTLEAQIVFCLLAAGLLWSEFSG